MTVSNIVLEALKTAVNVIDRQNLDYCLFGGLAMQGYKRIRATMDVDLMIAFDEEETPAFISTLEKNGFRFDRKRGIIKIGNFEILRFIYTDKKYEIDVFIDCAAVRTEFQREILRRKRKLEILGIRTNIASCEDLILLKVLAGRPIDKADGEVLLAENLKYIDEDYLKSWAKKLGVARELYYLTNRAKSYLKQYGH